MNLAKLSTAAALLFGACSAHAGGPLASMFNTSPMAAAVAEPVGLNAPAAFNLLTAPGLSSARTSSGRPPVLEGLEVDTTDLGLAPPRLPAPPLPF